MQRSDLGKVLSEADHAAQPRATNGHVARALVHTGNGLALTPVTSADVALTDEPTDRSSRGAASPSVAVNGIV